MSMCHLQIQIQMLQRYEQRTLEEDIYISNQELEEPLVELSSNDLTDFTPAMSSFFLLNMIEKLSSPLLGIQVLKNGLSTINMPHLNVFEMVFNKAELLYYESVIHDLQRISQSEELFYANEEDIHKFIQEINWKINSQKQDLAIKHQGFAQDVDLMKFFQGIRNYQNIQENLEKQCIERLKERAHQIENQLVFQKGFVLSKLTHKFQSLINNQKKELFTIYSKTQKHQTFSEIISTKYLGKLALSFAAIKRFNEESNNQNIFLKSLTSQLYNKSIKTTIKKLLNETKNYKIKTQSFCNRINRVFRVKEEKFKVNFLQKINLKSINKCMKIQEGVRILTNILKKNELRALFYRCNLHLKVMKQRMQKIVHRTVHLSFKQIWNASEEQLHKVRPQLSYKLKGKILLSLDKFQKTPPLNLRKTFLTWHLNTHENKFTKKIYNIWLLGSISKFTAFMRFKNVIDLNKKQNVTRELKEFIKILCFKFDHYQKFNQKNILTKWIQNTRRIKKINQMFQLLTNITEDNMNNLQNYTIQKLNQKCQKSRQIKTYLNKYLSNYMANTKYSYDQIKSLPKFKKNQGKILLRKLLLQTSNKSIENKKYVLNLMKNDHLVAKAKKIKFLTNIFNRDFIYKQKYFQAWRINNQFILKEENIKDKNTEKNKIESILIISKLTNTNNKCLIQSVIKQFVKNSQNQKKKIESIENKLFPIISNKIKESQGQVYKMLKEKNSHGRLKKERLVINLIHSLSTKQRMSLNMMQYKANEMKELDRRQRIQQIFVNIEESFHQKYSIWKKSGFVFNTLERISINYTNNIQISLDKIKAMPLRIRWKKRSNAVLFVDRFKNLLQNRLLTSFNAYRLANLTGNFKKKKIISIRVQKVNSAFHKYFDIFKKEVARGKQLAQSKITTHIFDKLNEVLMNNLKIIYKQKYEWVEKANHFDKLNGRVLKRVEQAFKLWINNVYGIRFYNKITDERKKRCLENFAKIHTRAALFREKKCLELFDKNVRITKLQVNFLKRLCDTQAGKAIKGFMLWKNLPIQVNKEKIVKATKFQSRLSKMAFRNLKQTFNAFKDAQYFGNQKKKYCIRQLVAKSCSGINQYFDQWRSNMKLVSLFTKCKHVEKLFQISHSKNRDFMNLFLTGNQAKNKLEAFGAVDRWWATKMQFYLKKWHKNMSQQKVQDLKKTYVLKSLAEAYSRHKLTKLKFIISKFTENRVSELQLKKIERSRSLLKVVQNYEQSKRVTENQSFQLFKYNHYKGNFLKNKAFHRWLTEKVKEVTDILTLWNGMASKEKEKDRNRVISHSFSETHQILKRNLSYLLAGKKENEIKKRSLDTIFKSTFQKYKGYFLLWQSHVKQMNILCELDKKTKATILERINKIVNNSSTQNVIKVIKMFHLNAKIQKVQRTFITRLLQTKSGQSIAAFKKWKGIPAQNLKGKYKKYQKFYFRLESFYKSRLSFVQNSFKEGGEEGNTMKKQSILKLFDTTSLGIRKFYNRWDRITKEKHILQKVNRTMVCFENMQNLTMAQYLIMFQDERAYNVKINAINRLIIAAQNNTQNYFKIWRKKVQEGKIFENLNKENKKTALKMFTNVLGNSSHGKVIEVISKFHKNYSVVKVSRNFFNKLMNTKTGKVLQLFQMMRSIPDLGLNKKKKKGIIFESSLFRFAMRRLKDSLAPFKDKIYEANSKKKFCIDKLVRAAMGENHKKFLLWRNINRQGKILSHSALYEKAFANTNNILQNSYNILLKDAQEEVTKKKSLCRKLITNSLFVQHHAYLIWKEAYYVDDIKIHKEEQKVRNHLKDLFTVFQNHSHKKSLQVINVFRRVLELRNIQEYSYYKEYQNRKCLTFFEKMTKIYQGNKHVFIESLKRSQIQIELIQKVQKVQNLFEGISQAFQVNLQMIANASKETLLKEQILNRIFVNFIARRDKGYQLWRESTKVMVFQNEMSDERKRNSLKVIAHLFNLQHSQRIVEAVKMFQTNLKVTKIKRQIFIKMVNSKACKVPIMFMAWKSLPYQEARKMKLKAMKFQGGLARMQFCRIKEIYQAFKKNQYAAQHIKKYATRKVIQAKLSDIHKIFFRWRKNNNEIKITDKILHLDRIMAIGEKTYINNFTIFQGARQQVEVKSKKQCLSKLFNNNVRLLFESWSIWRSTTKTSKLHKFEHCLRLFNAEDFNKRLLKIGFLMIQKKRDLQTLRGFINSLWKWKLSNIQANYYTKFIKVFKESQELLNLSNLLNRKQYENKHFAFRNIIVKGSQRSNRKKEIIQKYLLRKMKNYFDIFKQKIDKTEVQIWKSKYTESIKAKILIDVLHAVVLKQLSLTFNSITKYQQLTKNINKLEVKLHKFNQNNMRKAFQKLKFQGHAKLTQFVEVFSNRTQRSCLNSVFQHLKISYKTEKFEEILNRFQTNNNQRKGFYKIKEKKERVVRAKLSLILIETLLQNSKRAASKDVIQKFKVKKLKNNALQRLVEFLLKKEQERMKVFYENGGTLLEIARLLMRFRRGSLVKKILDRQDEELKRDYFTRMRKKQNNWIEDSIKMFASRSSIRSSIAIALWRMKIFSNQ